MTKYLPDFKRGILSLPERRKKCARMSKAHSEFGASCGLRCPCVDGPQRPQLVDGEHGCVSVYVCVWMCACVKWGSPKKKETHDHDDDDGDDLSPFSQ